MKRSGLVMVALVVGVMACGSKTKPATEPAPSNGSATGSAETAGKAVNPSAWTDFAAGPLTTRGGSVDAAFEGDADCYAIDGTDCGTSMSTGSFARVLHCTHVTGPTIECVVETGGTVKAAQHLCCLAVKGKGGSLSVNY